MRPKLMTLLLILAGSLTLAITEGQDPNAQTMGPQATTLLKAGVAGMEGKQGSISTVELAPGAVDARQFYPGVELVYVLEGAGSLEVDDMPPVALEPGTVVAVHPTHSRVLNNTSMTQTLKVHVVRLIDKGQPRLVLANGGTRPQKEECEVIPNGTIRQQKAKEQNNSPSTSPGTGLIF